MRGGPSCAAAITLAACGFQGNGDDQTVGDDGTQPTPPTLYASCQDALDRGMTTSGVYTLEPGYEAFCDQQNLGGGWTLVLKASGTAETFRYDASVWTDSALLRPDAPGHDLVEAKLASYEALAATELMIETLDGSTQFLTMPLVGDYTLGERIGAEAPQLFLPPSDRHAMWEGLVPTRTIPSCETIDGINVGVPWDHRVRIGVVGNDWDGSGCDEDWDAAIGVGLDTWDECDGSAPVSTTVGWNDGGCYEHAVFAYVYVR